MGIVLAAVESAGTIVWTPRLRPIVTQAVRRRSRRLSAITRDAEDSSPGLAMVTAIHRTTARNADGTEVRQEQPECSPDEEIDDYIRNMMCAYIQ